MQLRMSPGGRMLKFAAQASAGTAVVGDCNDGGKVVDDDNGGCGLGCAGIVRVRHVVLQALE